MLLCLTLLFTPIVLPQTVFAAAASGSLDARTPIPKATPEQVKLRASELQRQLDALDREFEKRDAKFMRANIPLFLSDNGPEINRVLDAHKKATNPLILKMTVIALRLQRYEQTGNLPESVPNVEQLREIINNPFREWAALPELALDLPTLIKQLRRYDKLGRQPSIARRATKPDHPAELFAIVQLPRPKSSGAAEPRLEKDAGKALPETDPIPELIALLSSLEPRLRALAADELGKRGAAAAAAIPRLKLALADSDARVRASAALAFSGIPDLPPDIADEIQKALGDKNADVRFSARIALEHIKGPQ